MDKSIETIWTNGFANEKKLSAPKIDRHYHKKSKLVIEKMDRIMKIDNMGLIPLAILVLVGFSYYSFFVLATFLFVVIIGIYIINTRVLKDLNKLSLKHSTYEYSKKYREAITNVQNTYKIGMAIGTPIVTLISYWLFFREFNEFQILLGKLSTLSIISIIIALSVLFSVFGIVIYKLSVKLVYGYLLEKLDEIIIDLDNLSKN